MSEIFLPVGQSSITRRSKNKLNQPFRKSNIGQNCLSYLGPKKWNNLPSELSSERTSTVSSIRSKINSSMISKVKMIVPTYTTENAKLDFENGIIISFSRNFFPEQISFHFYNTSGGTIMETRSY